MYANAIELLNELKSSGQLDALFKSGLISWKVIADRDIYLEVDKLVRLGMEKRQAITTVADNFKIAESSVYKALKRMKGKI